MSLNQILLLAGGLISGVIVGLKVIAPLTKTTADDAVLKKLEALEGMLQSLTK